MRRLPLLIAAGLFLCVSSAFASVIQVAPGDVTVNDTSNCSLVDAINAANASTVTNITVGACTPTGTPNDGGVADGVTYASGNIIVLAAGSYTLTTPYTPPSTYPGAIQFTAADGYWYGPDGLPPIASSIVIVGNSVGSIIERSSAPGTPPFRLFYIGGGLSLASYNAANVPGGTLPGWGTPDANGNLKPGSLTLVNLTLENGLAQGGDSTVGGGGLGAGGAIYNQGSLTLSGDTLTQNRAVGGATGVGTSCEGGGGIGGSCASGVNGAGFQFPSGFWPSSSAVPSQFGNGGAVGTDGAPGNDGGNGQFQTDGGAGSSGGNGQVGGVGGGGGGGGNGGSGGNGTARDIPIGGGLYDIHVGGNGGNGGNGGSGGNGIFGGGGGFGGLGGNGGDGLEADYSGVSGGSGGNGGAGGAGGFGGGGGSLGGPGGEGFGASPGSDGVGGVGGIGGFGAGTGGNSVGVPGAGTPGFGGGGAGLGGAVFNEGGTVSVLNSTFTVNSAQGGAGYFDGSGYGGSLFNLNGTVTIRYSTLASNTVNGDAANGGTAGSGAGGAVYNLFTSKPGSPVADAGTAATMTVNSSILSGSLNDASTATDCENGTYAGGAFTGGNGTHVTFTSGHDVLQTGGSCSFTNNDLSGTGRLAALADNGGPTQTMALQTGSLAVNMGDTGTSLGPVPTVDQRGFARDSQPDVGAFEFNNGLSITDLTDVSMTAPNPAGENFALNGTGVLTISAVSSNTTLLPNGNITISSGCGSDSSHYQCTLTLTPAADQTGSSKVTVTVSDAYGGSTQAAFVFTANIPPAPPVASDENLTTYAGQTLSGQLSAVASNGHALTYAVVTKAAHGSVKLTASTGAFTYTPNSGFTGSDKFTFKANDGTQDSNTATVTITVNAVPTAPAPPAPPSGSSGNSGGGGGAFGWLGLLLLAGLGLSRTARNKNRD